MPLMDENGVLQPLCAMFGLMADVHRTVAATGTWMYGGTVPRRIEIYARPVEFAGSRFNDVDEFDENSPVPKTADGFVYYVGAGSGGEFRSLEDAKRWADAQPWGPIEWD